MYIAYAKSLPTGVHSRSFSNARIESTGWLAQVFLEDGIARTYAWIAEQVQRTREREGDDSAHRISLFRLAPDALHDEMITVARDHICPALVHPVQFL